MAIDDRLFAPPDADAARVEARIAALPRRVQALIRRAGELLSGADAAAAQPALANALAAAPGQPDVLRLYALLLARLGNHGAAIANFDAALRVVPDDAVTYAQYARVCEDAGDVDAAFRLRQHAIGCVPDSPLAWLDFGEHLFRHQSIESSLSALARAAELAPDYAPGLFKFGNAQVSCGRAADGAALIRRAIALEPAFGAAWLGLVDIKTVPVADSEMADMHALLAPDSGASASERTAIGFALGQAYERAGRYADAWRHIVHANACRKQELPPWSPTRFRDLEQRTRDAFAAGRTRASRDRRLGEDAIFIVGLARSGTTLVEQILASHPGVAGGGELDAMTQVITEASAARQQQYPDWVAAASPDDWQRLGTRYLQLAAHVRVEQARFTDKLPGNWRALGAIRAMLPAARVIVCSRDPLENCWSCFKQYFMRGWEYTCDIDDLALFRRAFDHDTREWAARAPGYVRMQSYEALTEDPGTEIRALLDFCGLPFDAACLDPHRSPRGVRTLSAAQVREPIHRHRRITDGYGALLDPLRQALGLPAWTEPQRDAADAAPAG